jgi:hypothetical protein
MRLQSFVKHVVMLIFEKIRASSYDVDTNRLGQLKSLDR